jgi:hypothetical protein
MKELRPLRKMTGVPLLQRLKGETLTISAPEVLMACADVVSEGEVEREGSGDPVYSGSTLVTVDLTDERIEMNVGLGNLDRLLTAFRQSVLLRICLLRLARREAERRCAPSLVREMSADTEFRIEAERLLVDINIECPLADASEVEGSGKGGGL